MESLDKISSGAAAIADAPKLEGGNLPSTNVDSFSKPDGDTLEGALAMKEIGDSKENPQTQKMDLVKSLQKDNLEVGTDIKRVEELATQRKQEMDKTREALGMKPQAIDAILPEERQLKDLRARQAYLEEQREALLQEEMNEVFEQNVSETFAIFEKLPPEVFAVVMTTGKIPLMYKILSFVLGIDLVEEKFVMVLAKAYNEGVTTVYNISEKYPEFNVIREEMKSTIIDVATEKVLEEPEQKQIEDVKAEQNAIENGETPKELSGSEPRQIPETSGADIGVSSGAPVEGGGSTSGATSGSSEGGAK
ncbi:MAG: hypothetical protein EXS46_02775 [Candidatus Taylorbacteria bacterium]|nr:hypothetical protein [Candidatus Taylorbacteria bacterium]